MSDPTEQRLADENSVDALKVDASPTKEFFVDTITRDIALDRAIADLVDNCIDGAKRLRPADSNESITGVKRYDGLYARLIVTPNSFEIADNCGGIPIDIARRYAFKFGRAAGFVGTLNSVGQFGVGMKRALFKLGKQFEVSTADKHDAYCIKVNVPEWLDSTSWDFRIEDHSKNTDMQVDIGTIIRSSDLYPGVSDLFGQTYFLKTLKARIRVAQQHFMRDGFEIFVNGESIIPDQWQLQSGSGIEPSYQRFNDAQQDSSALITKIYSGVGPSNSANAGWYIFCNGRCIVQADQSSATGWGEVAGLDGVQIPKYHGQFSKFRGYAFLDCANSENLPWNTTKTGLDFEDQAYRVLFGRLVDAARPVINFLNELDNEKDFEIEDRVLSTSVAQSISMPISSLPQRASFSYSPSVKRGPPLKSISYKIVGEKVDQLAEKLGARSAKDVGIQSFDYAYQRLVVEDDL